MRNVIAVRRSPRKVALAAIAAALLALLLGVPFAGASPSAAATGVVVIETRLGFANAGGEATGMVLTSSGEVLTNNHVIRGAAAIRVRVPQTRRTYTATVLGYDVTDDIALIKLRGASGLHPVPLGTSSSLKLGQKVSAIGNAGGTGRLVTVRGTVTGLGQTITVSDGEGGAARLAHLIRTSASLRPGDSGGPLLDSSGRTIGMSAAASAELVFRAGGGEGFAIPIDRATAIASQIESGRSSRYVHVGATPFLGVIVDTRPGNTVGVVVTGVRQGSPAARAGLNAGDVIVSVNGHAVRTHAGLVARLLLEHPGDTVRLAWSDQLGRRHAKNVKLGSGPPQ
jgi:S1-C subfamily serine protease